MLYENRFRAAALAAALLLAPAALRAGGFFLTLGHPQASRDPLAKNAVFLVRPDGCHDPARATISAVAEGLVEGRRVSAPLKLVALGSPGTYAVRREWPAGGSWVVIVTASYEGARASALVPIGKEGFRRDLARTFAGEPEAGQVEALLRAGDAGLRAAKR